MFLIHRPREYVLSVICFILVDPVYTQTHWCVGFARTGYVIPARWDGALEVGGNSSATAVVAVIAVPGEPMMKLRNP